MRPLSRWFGEVSNKDPTIDSYRSIFENAIEGIFQTTPSGQYINVNPALAQMYGYDSTAELITRLTRIDNQLYVDPTRRDAFVSVMAEHGFVRGFESEIYRKDGSTIWISENARTVFDASGKISYYEGMVVDITERKRLEDDVRRVSRQMQALLESAGEGICGMDTEGRFTFINRAGAEMLGYAPDKLLGRNMHELVHHRHPDGSLYPIEKCPILRAFQMNQPCRIDTEVFWRSDNTSFPVEYSSYPIVENGIATGAVITFADITERKRSEEQIAEQAALLDKAQDAIMVCALDGGILFWNKGAESIYGWAREEAVGRKVGELLYLDPTRLEEINGLVLQQGEWFGEIQHFTRDRRELSVQARCTLVRDKNGNPKSVLAINTNITEKKKIEAQFMRAQRMESIGTLAGGIAHDLNNILAPIMMSIEVLKSTATDPQAKSILETIELSSKRGADIVRQVLSFARGVKGERIEVQPHHLLNDIKTIIKDTFPKNLHLDLSLPEEPWTIVGDPTQLHQVLLNLCVNARDAMPNGGNLTLSVENVVVDEQYATLHLEAKAGRYVAIKVSDTGTGIPPGLLDKIFDPFFTTKEHGEGTGLGLSTSMAIVKSHGGFINVYSEIRQGTVFTVYLPARQISLEAQKQKSGKVGTARGKGEMVLVVDDETSILAVTRQTLQAFGYRVLTAHDGVDALVVYLEHKEEIAVVLTDISMPVMDGTALTRALLKINPTVKIIATSGLNPPGSVTETTEGGGERFLMKPYSAKKLLKAIRAILDES